MSGEVSLAGLLAVSAQTPADPTASARPTHDEDTWPLSAYQARIWAGHLATGGAAYTVPCVLDVTGPCSAGSLREAVVRIMSIHPILRRGVVGDDHPHLAPLGRPVDVAVVPDLDRDDRDRQTMEILGAPWDPTPGSPLVRAAVLGRRIVLAFHHVLVDGASLTVLGEQLCSEIAHPGSVRGGNAASYPDVATRARIRGGDPAVRWWADRLRDIAAQSSWSADDLTAGDTCVTRAGISPAAGHRSPRPAEIAGAVAVALARSLSAPAVTLWIPMANRHDLEDFDVVGPLVNTVPVLARVDADDPTGSAQVVAESVAAAQDHASVPIDDVVAAHPVTAPPAQVFCNVQSTVRGSMAAGDCLVTPVGLHTGSAKAPVTVSVHIGDGELDCMIETAVAGCDEDTHQGIRDGIAAVLGSPPPPVPRPVRGAVGPTLVDRIAQRARHDPDAPAVVAPGESLTRGGLADRAAELRTVLAEQGVVRGDRVAVLARRDALFVAWCLAIMGRGATVVPIAADAPDDRVTRLATRVGARAIVADPSERPRLARTGRAGTPSLVDRSRRASVRTGPTSVAADDVAYILFTSGTTGEPKGVVVDHGAVATLVDATGDLIDESTVMSCIHAVTFDFSVWEIWCALAAGATTVLVPDDVVRDPFRLAPALAAGGVSLLSATDTAAGALLAAAEVDDGCAEALRTSVRRLVLGGERVAASTVAGWTSLCGEHLSVINMLGATETTVHTTRCEVGADRVRGDDVAVGHALAGYTVTVLDPGQRPTPLGVDGEVVVGGRACALGYWGDPRRTAAAFVPDPDGPLGSRRYRSGDIGRFRAHGGDRVLWCGGRGDGQVKVRGRRVEIAGVEHALTRCAGVIRAVVVVDGSALTAFVVTAPGTTATAVRAAVATRLAGYEIPDRVVVVADLPRTVNGKLDRTPARLWALALPDPVAVGLPDAPVGAPHAVLAAVGAVLRRPVEPSLSFLAHGGDSISAVRVVGDLRAEGVTLAVGDLLADTPLGDVLAQDWIDDDPAVAPFALVSADVVAHLPVDVIDAYPLSAAQEGMLFHTVLEGGTGVYHNTMSVRLHGVVDAHAFRAAVAETVARHDVLRTSIHDDLASTPLQLVHASVSDPLVVIDATDGDDAEQRALLDRLVDGMRSTPFDLTCAPLFRMTLVRTRRAAGDDPWVGDEHQLVVADSHTILDGWSWTSTIAEIVERHDALRTGEPRTERAAPDCRFVDFVAAERRARTSDAAARAWRAHLGGVRPSRVADRLGGGDRKVRRHTVLIDGDLDAALRERAARSGVGLRHLALAAHYDALAELYDDDEVVTGLVWSGRPERLGGTDIRGMFLNVVPVRLEVDPDPVVTARRLARVEADLAPHRRRPGVDITTDVGRGPLTDHGANFVRFDRLADIERLVRFGDTQSPHHSREDTDLALMATFSVHPPAHRLALMLVVDEARVSRGRVDELVDLHAAALRGAAGSGTTTDGSRERDDRWVV